jgi:hypothetical protein
MAGDLNVALVAVASASFRLPAVPPPPEVVLDLGRRLMSTHVCPDELKQAGMKSLWDECKRSDEVI